MQVVKRTLFLVSLLFALSAGSVLGQTPGGIRVKEEKALTVVYQIKVIGLGGPISAAQLDESLRNKRQVVSAVTDPNTAICTVEVAREFETRYFSHVLASHGLRMAKKFD